MPRYRLCVSWAMSKIVEVEAATREEACAICARDCGVDDGEYVDDSFFILDDDFTATEEESDA